MGVSLCTPRRGLFLLFHFLLGAIWDLGLQVCDGLGQFFFTFWDPSYYVVHDARGLERGLFS